MALSSLYSDERNPPDDAARLTMFLDSVDSYEQLEQAHPLPTSYNLHGLTQSDYWILVLHAGVLRKFFAPTDQTNIAKVVESIGRLVLVDDPVLLADLAAIPNYGTFRTVPVPIQLNVGGHDVKMGEVVEVELYGRHLHADYGKWVASQRIREGSWNWHMGQWCLAAVLVVRHAAESIRWWSENGLIDFDAPARSEH